jgi:hypothetical protein
MAELLDSFVMNWKGWNRKLSVLRFSFWHLHGGSEENYKKSLRISSGPVEI